MNTNNKASRGQLILLIAIPARLGLSLLLVVFLGRLLTPADFGFFALVSTLFVASRDLMNLGNTNAATREASRKPELEMQLLENLLGWRVILGIVLSVICLSLNLGISDSHQRAVIFAAAAVIPFLCYDALLPVFQRRQAYTALSVLGLASQGLLLAACVAVAYLGGAGYVFALLVVCREVIYLFVQTRMAGNLLGKKVRPARPGAYLSGFFRMALTLGLASVVYNFLPHLGAFLIWLLRTEQELGAFSSSFRLIFPLQIMIWTLMVPLIPVLSRAAVTDRKAYREIVESLFYLGLGIGSVCVAAGLVLAPEIMQFLYGPKYSTGDLSAIWTFRWLSLALGSVCLASVMVTALTTDRREGPLLKLILLLFALNLVANLVLLPVYGFTATAFSLALTELLFLAGCFRLFGHSECPVVFDSRVIKFTLPAVILFGVIHFIPLEGRALLALGCVLSGLAILALLFSPALKRYLGALAELKE